MATSKKVIKKATATTVTTTTTNTKPVGPKWKLVDPKGPWMAVLPPSFGSSAIPVGTAEFVGFEYRDGWRAV